MASWSRISPELSEGSLGRTEVVGAITTWCDAWDQPRRKNFLGLFTQPPQSYFRTLSLRRVRGVRCSTLRPRYCHRKNITRGFPGCHLSPWPWWWQWLMPEGGYSFQSLPCWPFACGLAYLEIVTCGGWKITALAIRARLEPKGWPIFSWGFNLLWNDWPFKLVTPFTVPGACCWGRVGGANLGSFRNGWLL